MLSVLIEKYSLFLLLLARMGGAVFINPLFGRRNIPTTLRAALSALLAMLLAVSVDIPAPKMDNVLDFIVMGIVEFGVGYALSLIMYTFFSTIMLACEQLDMQIGIGIAKVYDPIGNMSAAVTGMIYNTFMILLFFGTNSHITFFNILSQSVRAIPCGSEINISNAALEIFKMFGYMLSLATKFAMPIMAVQFVTEIGLGVLTRAVPHINIFSVGIQLKLLVGLLVLMLLAPAFGAFCDDLFREMFTSMAKAIRLM